MKITRALAATVLFVVLLIAVYYVHVTFFRVGVVFYAAITDGIIATVLASMILLATPYFRIFDNFNKLLLVIIWLLAGYSYAISIPTVIDRSLSFYILEKLQQRGGGIKQSGFEEVFKQEYMKEHHLIDVRLTEQMESGTIIIDNGCVKLTEKGEVIVRFSLYFRRHWLPKERLLLGKYTDDLTDPFRYSEKSPAYKCE